MRLFLGCVLVSALSVACSSDSSSTTSTDGGGSGGGSGSDGSSGGSGGSSGSGGGTSTGGTAGTGGTSTDGGDAGAKPVTFSGTTVVGIPGENGKEGPLAGVEVCVEDATGKAITAIACVVTNAKGEYSFADLDPHQQLIMTFKKAGYGEQIIAADIGTADASRAPVRLVAGVGTAADGGAADAGAADAGGPPSFGWDPSVVMDSSKGMLNTFAVAQASSADAGTAAPGFDFLEGVSFAIAPKSGVGPFYMDASEKYVAGATSSSGGYGAWFLNVTPGTVTVTATSATYTCSAVAGNGYGWAQTDGSAKAPIVAGLNTQSIGFFCTKK